MYESIKRATTRFFLVCVKVYFRVSCFSLKVLSALVCSAFCFLLLLSRLFCCLMISTCVSLSVLPWIDLTCVKNIKKVLCPLLLDS